MRSIDFKRMLLILLWCFCSAPVLAAPVENAVIVEIETIDMSDDEVENVIADPIEVLLGSLDGVYLVSAKYRANNAIINVRFSETPEQAESLLNLVKNTIDEYLDKLPNNIESISISLEDEVETGSAEPETPLSTEPEATVEESSGITEQEPVDTLVETPNKIRKVEKRSKTGRYLGSIQSSNEYLPIITTLTPSSLLTDNVAGGKYVMSEHDAIVTGEVFDCMNNTGNVLTCQWRDKYGTGGVDFVFTPDYSAFNGRWSINGAEGSFKWSGLKVKEE